MAELENDEVTELELPVFGVDGIIVDELLKKFVVAELKVDEVPGVKLPLLDVDTADLDVDATVLDVEDSAWSLLVLWVVEARAVELDVPPFDEAWEFPPTLDNAVAVVLARETCTEEVEGVCVARTVDELLKTLVLVYGSHP